MTNIDSILGNPKDRYFGKGYKNANYKVRDLKISGSSISALGSILYDGLWSNKDGGK